MKRRLVLFFLPFMLFAHGQPIYPLPHDSVTRYPDAVSLEFRAQSLTYVFGLGWLNGERFPAPLIENDVTYVSEEVLDALEYSRPRLSAIRLGGDDVLRIVLDFENLEEGRIENLTQAGEQASGEVLALSLPALLLPRDVRGLDTIVELYLNRETATPQLEISGEAFDYEVFTLESPTRLVVDLRPRDPVEDIPITQQLRDGVTYQRFRFGEGLRKSRVHVLEIKEGAGEFRVVGNSGEANTLSNLASGAFAAINAGYFDPPTSTAVGLLKVDYHVQTLPTPNRTSIAINGSSLTMSRLNADVWMRISNEVVALKPRPAPNWVELSLAEGLLIGDPNVRVMTVQGGRVTNNAQGPLEIPKDGFALIYDPSHADLLRVQRGDFVAIETAFSDRHFDEVRYAVEAGPLLIRAGQPAFAPELEGFPRNQRVLDGVTQQAVLATRGNGDVLFVISERMKAEDLIPLLQSLGVSDATRLDSGGSATLFADGRVYNRFFERPVVSAIIFLPY